MPPQLLKCAKMSNNKKCCEEEVIPVKYNSESGKYENIVDDEIKTERKINYNTAPKHLTLEERRARETAQTATAGRERRTQAGSER